MVMDMSVRRSTWHDYSAAEEFGTALKLTRPVKIRLQISVVFFESRHLCDL